MSELLERVLILGGSGQLGKDLRAALSAYQVTAPPHSQICVENADSLMAAFRRYRPTLVINTSAFHQLDACESEPARAYEINAFAVDRIASLCALSGAAFAHVSTDYVFGGDTSAPYGEGDAPRPICIYGLSKFAGEQLLQRHSDRWFIFRVSGLYGPSGTTNKGVTFIERVLRQAEQGQPLRVVDDVTFSPSYTIDVAASIRAIIERGAFGLYHLTNAGSCTWYDFAAQALSAAGFDTKITRAKDADFRGLAQRPMFTALRHDTLARNGFEELPDWRDAVHRYVRQRSSHA
jgi:dTDP-4-dehydrorhamnose reductase